MGRLRMPAPSPAALVKVRGLAHAYVSGHERVVALRGVDLDLSPGELVAITGRSGSGKTTLLNILAGLETPASGRVTIAGHDLSRMTGREREGYRRRVVGCVWQEPELGLLPGLTVLQNVLVPMLGETGSQFERVRSAVQLLDVMRLGSRLDDRLRRLAPVETRRLALAVALANRPRLLLADEVTAGLQWAASSDLLGDLVAHLGRTGTAAVIVSHDRRLLGYVHRAVLISDGVAEAVPAEARAAAGRGGVR